MSIDMAEEEYTKDCLHLAMIDRVPYDFLSNLGGNMLDQIIVIYCVCDEVSKCLGIRDDEQHVIC